MAIDPDTLREAGLHLARPVLIGAAITVFELIRDVGYDARKVNPFQARDEKRFRDQCLPHLLSFLSKVLNGYIPTDSELEQKPSWHYYPLVGVINHEIGSVWNSVLMLDHWHGGKLAAGVKAQLPQGEDLPAHWLWDKTLRYAPLVQVAIRQMVFEALQKRAK